MANVLSTTTSAPRAWASSHTASMSMQLSSGLVGVSSHTIAVSSGSSTDADVGQVGRGPRQPERAPHPGDQPERAAVGVVAEHDAPPGRDEAQHVVLGGQPAGEGEPVTRRLERRHARLERGACRVARPGVLVAAVAADAVLGERRRQRDRRHHRAGRRIGRLPGVHGAGVEPERGGVVLVTQRSCPPCVATASK